MPCNKCALNFKKRLLKKTIKTGYFQSIASAIWFYVFQWNLANLFSCPFLLSGINLQEFASVFWRFCNPKFEKWKNTKKWPRSHRSRHSSVGGRGARGPRRPKILTFYVTWNEVKTQHFPLHCITKIHFQDSAGGNFSLRNNYLWKKPFLWTFPSF